MNAPAETPAKRALSNRRLTHLLPIAVKSIGVASSVAFPLMLTLYFGTHEAGVVQYYISVCVMIASVARLGYAQVLFRAGTVDNPIVQYSYWCHVTAQTALASGALTLCYLLIIVLLTDQSRWVLAGIAGLTIFPVSLTLIDSEFEKGRGNTVGWALLHNSAIYFIASIGLLFVYLSGGSASLYGLIAYVIATWAVAMFSLSKIWTLAVGSGPAQQALTHGAPAVSGETAEMPRGGAILRESVQLSPMAFNATAQTWLDVTVVGFFGDAASVALIRLAGRFSFLPAFIHSLSNAILTPRLARAIRERNAGQIRRLWRLTSLIPLVAGLLCAALALSLLIAFRPYLVERELELLPGLFAIMCIGNLSAVSAGAVVCVLLTCENDHALRTLGLAAFPLAAALQIILVINFGVFGSAIASAFYLTLYHWALFLSALKSLRIYQKRQPEGLA